jgi:hypothetical protein
MPRKVVYARKCSLADGALKQGRSSWYSLSFGSLMR